MFRSCEMGCVTFNDIGDFSYASSIGDAADRGMVGTITVQACGDGSSCTDACGVPHGDKHAVKALLVAIHVIMTQKAQIQTLVTHAQRERVFLARLECAKGYKLEGEATRMHCLHKQG